MKIRKITLGISKKPCTFVSLNINLSLTNTIRHPHSFENTLFSPTFKKPHSNTQLTE
jgi:hypothetical protein